jgi:hypothetical protein
MTLEIKLKIIANFDAGKCAVIRNVEADLHCYNEVLHEMKKPRIQLTLHSFFRKTDNSQPSNCALYVSSIKLLKYEICS